MKFRTVTGEDYDGNACPRCGAPMLYREFSDGASETVCSKVPTHDGELCKRIGHSGEYGEDACPTCGAPAQYVRVEVVEGKTYTYKAYEEPPLEKGEWVRMPGNQVQTEPFAGKVIRALDGPDERYAGPYKAVLGRLL